MADLDGFRDYLMILARTQLGVQYRGKLDASDVVQEALLQAHVDLSGFRGKTDAEMAGWLRTILARVIARATRALHRARRNVDRERSLQQSLEASSIRLEELLAIQQSSPSLQFHRHEMLLKFANALESLSEKQRETIVLRFLSGWKLNQIAEHLGVTHPTVMIHLQRGIERLRELLPDWKQT